MADLNAELIVATSPSLSGHKAIGLGTLGICFYERYQVTHDPVHLNLAIENLENALAIPSIELESKRTCLRTLSTVLLLRSVDIDGNLDDLEQAVRKAEESLELTPPSHSDRPATLDCLALALRLRYNAAQNLQDLQRAVVTMQNAERLIPENHPERPIILYHLSGALNQRYSVLRNGNDLEEALQKIERALDLTPSSDRRTPGLMDTLGVILLSKFEATGSHQYLERAIGKGEAALRATGPSDPTRPLLLDHLALAFQHEFNLAKNVEHINQSIAKSEEAVHAHRLMIPGSLSQSLAKRYDRLGIVEDLQNALSSAKEVLDNVSTTNSHRSVYLDNLSWILLKSYAITKDPQVLEEASSKIIESLHCSPAQTPNQPITISHLADCFLERGKNTGLLEDYDLAIAKDEEALKMVMSVEYPRIRRLDSLSLKYYAKYSRFGTTPDLETAILLSQAGLKIDPSRKFDRLSILINLGVFLKARFFRFTQMNDLERSIFTLRQALSLCSTETFEQGEALSNLADALQASYEETGNAQNIHEAISNLRKAIAIPSLVNSPEVKATYLNNLANKLKVEYQRTGALQLVQEAIFSLDQSLHLRTRPSPFRALCWSNQSNAYQLLFGRTGSFGDLEMCLICAEKSVNEIPRHHPERLGMLSNYSNKLHAKWTFTGDIEDLEAALDISQEAVVLLSEQKIPAARHQEAIFKNLGVQYQSMFTKTGNQTSEFSNKAVQAFLDAWKCESSPAFDRIKASGYAIDALSCLGMWQEASSIADDAVKLFPQVFDGPLDRIDQENQLSRLSGLAGIACALTLQAEKSPLTAIIMLEASRGVIYQQALKLKTRLSELSRRNPSLFNKWQRLRALASSSEIEALTGLSSQPEGSLDDQTLESIAIRKHINDVNKLHEVLDAIRSTPGLETLQTLSSTGDLIRIASEGPIIVLNCLPLRSDALILTGTGATSIQLPSLIFADVVENVKLFTGVILKRCKSLEQLMEKNRKMGSLLRWLWYSTVEPVMRELHLEAKSSVDALPRLWWIGVGLMSILPLHVAGDYSKDFSYSTMARVLSSYTPTINALSSARKKPMTLLGKEPSILIVAMDQTSGQPDLSTDLESAQISTAVEGRCSTTIMKRPTPSLVLQSIDSYEIVHCICHGISDLNNPSNSGLILQADNTYIGQGGTSELTVAEISNKSSRRSQLAFLSACGTARNRPNNLVDEVIHIGSGFQLAGFKHVVGTMWKAGDLRCANLAGAFYYSLFQGNGAMAGGHRAISVALYEAVLAAREENKEDFLSWAPFIHMGA
ncbi:hypothetical protein BDZ45DRAFT_650404 [Acephala macrosclerotiorum]|nr:hypothetical protein BDZ45DRAFT_650404 [Acephala macrosclerotiorum]